MPSAVLLLRAACDVATSSILICIEGLAVPAHLEWSSSKKLSRENIADVLVSRSRLGGVSRWTSDCRCAVHS